MKYFIVFVALCLTPFCNGQNNSDAQVSDSTTDEKTSLQKGMDPIFDLYHNFLDTVMPYNFYDDSGETPFSVQDVISVIKNEDYDRLQDEWQDLVKSFGGFAACIICGLLFVVFMPIVGFIYCCCSCCCHKCTGTREEHDPKHAKCKRVTYTTLLLIFATAMLAGAIITFLGADLLHRSLKNEDNKGLTGGMDNSIDEMRSFINETLKDITKQARTQIIEVGLNGILKSITDTAFTTVDRVKNVINATGLLNQADSIGEAAETALSDLETIGVTLANLTALQNNVTDTLTKVKDDVNTECGGNQACSGLALNSLTFQPNFTSLETLSDELDKVKDANNITGLVAEARDEFNKVSNDVNSTVGTEIDNASGEIDRLTTTINNELGNLDGISQGFVDAMDDGKSWTSGNQETIEEVGNYIWYACIGMACAVLLVVVFYYMGVLFGLCGERPSPEAACCNKGTGSNLIVAGICFSFLFCWLLMLVVILTFTLGGLSYSMACKYLDDGVEHVENFENVVSEGFGWNISQTFNTTNLTIAGMLNNCKENQGVYTALNLKHLFDIDKELDISEVETQVRNIINKVNINIDSITLLSPDLKQQLEDFTASNISTVNYTKYIVEAEKELFSGSLDTTIDELYAAATLATGSLNTTLRKAAADLEVVRDVMQPAIQAEINKLKTSVTSLQSNSNVTAQVSSLIANIEASETTFNQNSSDIVNEQLRLAGEGILDSIRAIVNNTKEDIKYNIGRCRRLYIAANSIVQSVCVVTLDPLNAIWFGLGWSLFFYIPSFIFAALLGSLYKRPEKYEERRKPDFDTVDTPYSGYNNGYHGGRNEEQYPLTSVDNSRSRDKVGSQNYAYEGRDYDQGPRYHRDDHRAHTGYPGQGASGGGRGPAYAQPYAGSQDPYDGYERTPPPRYDDVTSHGRPRGDHGGYPKLRNY